jgi:anti-sigma-K factor RskA
MATRRPPHALPPRHAHGQRRRVDRNPLWRLALAALLAVVALAAAGSLLALH